jgi:hypothetical protein
MVHISDGSYKEGMVAGCGSVIRGSDSEWLSGFAKLVGLLCKIHVAVVDV